MAVRLNSTETDTAGEGYHLQEWHEMPAGSAPLTGVTAWTLTAWVYADLAAGVVVFSTLETASPFNGISMVIFGTSGQVGIWDPGTTSYIASAVQTLPANTWSLCAIRCLVASSGGTVQVSVNGGTWDTIKSGNTSALESDTGMQNTGHTNDANWTSALISDLRHYSRQLSQAEIETLYGARGRDDIVDYDFRYPMNEKPPSRKPESNIVGQAFSTSPSGTSFSVSVPAEAQAQNGLGMICVVACTNNTGTPPTITPPSGWTLRNSGNTDAPSTFSTPRVEVYTRNGGSSSEPSSYTWTFSNSSTGLALMMAVNGTAEAPNVIQASTGTSASPSCPSASPSANALVLRIACIDSQDPVPAAYYDMFPAGISGNVIARRFVSGLGNGVTFGIASHMVASGATGTAVWAPTISEQWICLTMAWLMGSGVEQGPKDVGNSKLDAISYGATQVVEDSLF